MIFFVHGGQFCEEVESFLRVFWTDYFSAVQLNWWRGTMTEQWYAMKKILVSKFFFFCIFLLDMRATYKDLILLVSRNEILSLRHLQKRVSFHKFLLLLLLRLQTVKRMFTFFFSGWRDLRGWQTYRFQWINPRSTIRRRKNILRKLMVW